mmetsp:Transcript_35265/g.80557  ORF Transcript_35265/g.80557 Transcript_35265/m.80557 type:complete len:255 (+) Transcript_35265:76-840(+)|eukprot:CAMPEP_0114561212 /NCGR_PEP_ID=MMETSP0114-20121206/11882_1 /TAXON_ID=31324 /ORGANISM="Goniomonas sp, Strain m" /LENGTH=254 /DNA_ID=CAMNT_0001746829 /DNA_START=76 /DNA_END=840 /DNA_ORIENTATION=+
MSLLESREMPILLWVDLSVEQVEVYEALEDPEERRKFIASVIGINLDTATDRDKILLEMCNNVMLFCSEKGFTPDKTSSFFGIMKHVHSLAMARFWPLEKTFTYFKNILMKHSVQRPPFSTGIFSLQDVRDITDSVTKGYFRHYLLYKYCFTKKTELDLETIDSHTLFPQPFTALAEALPEEEALKQMTEQDAGPTVSNLTEEDLEGVPDEIRKAVLEKVNSEMQNLRGMLESRFAKQEEEFLARIEALQEKLK